MDWVQQDSLLPQEDFRLFKFPPYNSTSPLPTTQKIENQVLGCVKGDDDVAVTSLYKKLETDEDWNRWLDEVYICVQTRQSNADEVEQKQTERLEPRQSSITLLIGGRVKPRIPGMEVSYLPFSRPVFTRIVDVFQIHRSISRVVNRNTTATFSALLTKCSSTNRSTLVYNCRSSATWADDLGLSVTYSPYHRTTQAVLYGCCKPARDRFVNRLQSGDFAAYHPLTLPTIFAEVERNRHFGLVNPLITKLVDRVETLDVADEQQEDTEQSYDGRHSSLSEKSSQTNDNSESFMQLWLQISWLKNGLEDWRRQLQKMVAHCDELQQANFHIPYRGFKSSRESTPVNASSYADGFDEKREDTLSPDSTEYSDLEDSGSRIQGKLLELLEEYDEKIRACATIVDGMALAAQLEWNKIGRKDTRTNLKISKSSLVIAEATKKDGQRMRSIAVLTMIFLPATFVATVFSMTFFNWTPGQGQAVLSPYIWIYVVGTAIFTGLTMGLWYIYSRRHEKNSDRSGDVEKQQ